MNMYEHPFKEMSMQAALTPSYGPPSVVAIREVSPPDVGPNDVLIAVQASAVTEGDRRLRSADFPGISMIMGRLMMGLFKPRAAVQGTMFAGQVVQIGERVQHYAVGDEVFGSAEHGAHAELLCLNEDAAMTHMPRGLSFEQAAAIPYGAGTALHFLSDLAGVQPGESVAIVGAAGGVGRFAVQLASHLGATVTAVCSAADTELMRSLGADRVIDYRSQAFPAPGQSYDVIFDIADATSFGMSRKALKPNGRYLSLIVSSRILAQMAWTRLTGGRRALFSVAFPSRQEMARLADLAASGVFQPVIGERYPLRRIRDAHAAQEARARRGATLVVMSGSHPSG